jgi:hypothetical protein
MYTRHTAGFLPDCLFLSFNQTSSMYRKIYFFLLIAAIPFFADAQEDEDLVQFSGVVVTSDSLHPLPFSSIIIRNTYRGTISDFYGFFSFVARVNDTIDFSSIGFKKAEFIIPDTLTENRYSLIQVLSRDTIMLREAVIFPWPTKEQFKQAFLTLEVPDDDLQRARRNLENRRLQEIAQNLPPDGSMAYRAQVQQQYSRLYTVGQLPMNNLLNPIAWAKFIDSWKSGKFKREEDKFDD